MKNTVNTPDKIEKLRIKAEETLGRLPKDNNKFISKPDVENILHEMQVYQIELEMQNDELRKTQQELEESLNKYTELYDYAPVGYLTFDRSGLILKANLTAAKMLGKERAYLINKPFAVYLDSEEKSLFFNYLKHVFMTSEMQILEISVNKSDKSSFFAHFASQKVFNQDLESSQCILNLKTPTIFYAKASFFKYGAIIPDNNSGVF